MTTDIATAATPFDAGCIPCPQGGEDRWSARWLMGQMGYPTWQHFEPVVERAKTTAHNEGFNVRTLFTVDRKNTGGRPQTDVRHSQCGDVQYDHYAQFAHYFLPRETVVQHQWGSCSHYTLMVLPRGVELIAKRLRTRGLAHDPPHRCTGIRKGLNHG